ncbi:MULTISPECIES: riboflavin kinase [unclassified Microbacterium]|uniref:riboflavin kinase n=1 Tax=unclassified Microbacterium TaxID=2609290 RepID=UPI0024692A44|nr:MULTISPECIES: riboflavin kinase [unclassified Microbacterium]MDH5132173.1 riboflavin kinase [Microbacterium sp. RD10]MDH5135880.1 riboflavin kinase [Microbacterium sp. RD11]MDH5143922.1 riboflavin kinase [Microbacterium sp. RD12]MDH5153122.1 riboflavin kinase [Microbacterium sp. RD06]MDH5164794.1 riboflavin kinase [Microbacterium sp. RD02]
MSGPAPRVLSGLVVPGDGRGRLLGFPTANLALSERSLPDDGIYAAWALLPGDDRRWEATASIGVNPTFCGDRARRLEVHLHDIDRDLYGQLLSVELVALLRPTLRFDGVAELVARTAADVAASRRLLAAERRTFARR